MRRLFALLALLVSALQAEGQEFKIYRFAPDQLPTIDGKGDDWASVTADYRLTEQAMKEDEGKHAEPNPATLRFSVRVGWCAETQRLYFLYEATDDYWRFSENSLQTDIFEVVVDGDCSGGPFIDRFHPTAPKDIWQAWFKFHGCHAQNYHIFTPAHGEDWCMYWGPQTWLKEPPYADYAYHYSFGEGEEGKLTLEFYITPYDHADERGPQHSRPTRLEAGNEIGLCWAVIDWDAHPTSKNGFWNLSDNHQMYGNASYLRRFRLMNYEQ